jgi:predicted ribosome quality control (RQC) complex YloA/Tae2 family protein
MFAQNPFFIASFVKQVAPLIYHQNIVHIFEVTPNETIIDFGANGHMRIHLFPDTLCYAFFDKEIVLPKQYKPRFKKLWNQKLIGIKQPPYDRCFMLEFSNNLQLVFALFGRNANVYLFNSKETYPLEVLNYKRKGDLVKTFENLTKGYEITNDIPLKTTSLPFMTDWLQTALVDSQFESKIEFDNAYQNLVSNCFWSKKDENDTIVLEKNQQNNQNSLSFLRIHYIAYVKERTFLDRKNELSKSFERQLQKQEKSLLASKQRLLELTTQRSYKEIADIIMANSYCMDKEGIPYTLIDFYLQNQPLTVTIPKDMTAVQYATKLYKKEGNKPIEMAQLQTKIAQLEESIYAIKQKIGTLTEMESHKHLKGQEKRVKEDETILPYHGITYLGHAIWIGKNAKANDLLLRNFSQKNDLWLHAKDHAGSHVIIKRSNPKIEIPKEVIIQAASYAAWFSKGKNHSLLPVIVTERKFVRKNKHHKAGQVTVDKEQTVLVKPIKPQS